LRVTNSASKASVSVTSANAASVSSASGSSASGSSASQAASSASSASSASVSSASAAKPKWTVETMSEKDFIVPSGVGHVTTVSAHMGAALRKYKFIEFTNAQLKLHKDEKIYVASVQGKAIISYFIYATKGTATPVTQVILNTSCSIDSVEISSCQMDSYWYPKIFLMLMLFFTDQCKVSKTTEFSKITWTVTIERDDRYLKSFFEQMKEKNGRLVTEKILVYSKHLGSYTLNLLV
jgi:hypothetical protein